MPKPAPRSATFDLQICIMKSTKYRNQISYFEITANYLADRMVSSQLQSTNSYML